MLIGAIEKISTHINPADESKERRVQPLATWSVRKARSINCIHQRALLLMIALSQVSLHQVASYLRSWAANSTVEKRIASMLGAKQRRGQA